MTKKYTADERIFRGARVQRLMNDHKCSVLKMSEILEVSPATVANKIRGEIGYISDEDLMLINQAFKIDDLDHKTFASELNEIRQESESNVCEAKSLTVLVDQKLTNLGFSRRVISIAAKITPWQFDQLVLVQEPKLGMKDQLCEALCLSQKEQSQFDQLWHQQQERCKATQELQKHSSVSEDIKSLKDFIEFRVKQLGVDIQQINDRLSLKPSSLRTMMANGKIHIQADIILPKLAKALELSEPDDIRQLCNLAGKETFADYVINCVCSPKGLIAFNKSSRTL